MKETASAQDACLTRGGAHNTEGTESLCVLAIASTCWLGITKSILCTVTVIALQSPCQGCSVKRASRLLPRRLWAISPRRPETSPVSDGGIPVQRQA